MLKHKSFLAAAGVMLALGTIAPLWWQLAAIYWALRLLPFHRL
jgi:hypothetical protein